MAWLIRREDTGQQSWVDGSESLEAVWNAVHASTTWPAEATTVTWEAHPQDPEGAEEPAMPEPPAKPRFFRRSP